jgi:hypothetical protein
MYTKVRLIFLQLYIKLQCTFLIMSLIALSFKRNYRKCIIVLTPVKMFCYGRDIARSGYCQVFAINYTKYASTTIQKK